MSSNVSFGATLFRYPTKVKNPIEYAQYKRGLEIIKEVFDSTKNPVTIKEAQPASDAFIATVQSTAKDIVVRERTDFAIIDMAKELGLKCIREAEKEMNTVSTKVDNTFSEILRRYKLDK